VAEAIAAAKEDGFDVAEIIADVLVICAQRPKAP
jgi:hypothetical protein